MRRRPLVVRETRPGGAGRRGQAPGAPGAPERPERPERPDVCDEASEGDPGEGLRKAPEGDSLGFIVGASARPNDFRMATLFEESVRSDE